MQSFNTKSVVITLVIAAVLSAVAWATARISGTDMPSSTTPTPTVSSSPTTAATTSWKTFTNTAFGYTLQYPTDLELIEEYIELEKSDQISLAYLPGTPDYEVRFGLKAVYVGYLDNLPTVKEALASGNLEQFATYLWDSNKNDINPETQGRTVSDLKKLQVNGKDAYTFTVTNKLTIGKGEAKGQDGTINYPLNTWQDFKREQQVTVLAHGQRFFIVFYPAAYSDGQAILESIRFN